MNETTENFVLESLSQEELNVIIKKHNMFLSGKPGGARAYVKDRDLSHLKFEGAVLSQSDFTGCIFYKANLKGTNFDSATLFGCDLSFCEMQKSSFARSDLRGADIQHSNLTDANLSGADLRAGTSVIKRKMKKNDDTFGKAKAGQVTFNGSILRNVSLRGTTAINTDFSDAIMENVNLMDADLREANFMGANLSGAQMTGSDLRDADFAQATLTNTVMENTEQGGTRFTQILADDNNKEIFDEVALSLDELIEKHTQWVGSAGKHGDRMDLSRYDMRKLESLSGRKLTAIIAEETIFAEMNLQKISFQSAKLDKCDFRHSDLRHADCRGAQIRDAIFIRASLQQANFGPLIFKKPDGSETIMPCRLNRSSFRYADCKGTDFRYADFKNADLTHADFTDCDLRHADFRGAVLDEILLSNTLTANAVFDPHFDPEQGAEDR